MARIQTENGPRYVMRESIRGHVVEVVAGYNVMGDNYRFHIYATGPTGIKRKVSDVGAANTMQEAFDDGFASADALLADQNQTGLASPWVPANN